MGKVWRHRDQYNKVGKSHYSFRDQEMYARKVPLLQVLKYMPSSIELSNAMAAAHAAESGRNATIDGDIVTIPEEERGAEDSGQATQADTMAPEVFEAKKTGWKKAVMSGVQSSADVISFIESKDKLSDAQRAEIESWAKEGAAA